MCVCVTIYWKWQAKHYWGCSVEANRCGSCPCGANSLKHKHCACSWQFRRSVDGMEAGAGVVVLIGVHSHWPFFQYWNKLQWTWFGAWFSRGCFNTERIKSEPLLSDEPWHSAPAPGLVLAWTRKVGCSQWFLNLSMTFFLKLHGPWVLHLQMNEWIDRQIEIYNIFLIMKLVLLKTI